MLDACFRSESTFLLSLVVNPCDGHDCSHLCLLSVVAVEGYVCACPDGAILEDDGRECNCKDNNTSLVDLYSLFLSMQTVSVVTPSPTPVEGMSYRTVTATTH